jgi:hypothetical protein
MAKSDYKLRQVCPFVRFFAWNNYAPIGQILMKLGICIFFENMSRKFKFHENRTTKKGTLHEW